MNYSAKQLGKRIRDIRERKGIKVREVASAMDISTQHVYHFEAGKRELTITRLQEISRILKVDPAELLNGKKRGAA